MNELRGRIARAINDVGISCEGLEEPGSIETCDQCQALLGRAADGVVAVLADLPDDVIEQCAKSMRPELWESTFAAIPHVIQGHGEDWDAALHRTKEGYRDQARKMLTAFEGYLDDQRAIEGGGL